MIAIVDYGVGNLFSLASSFAAIGAEVTVTGDAGILRTASHVVLPGVGAFGDARKKLSLRGLDAVLCRIAEEGKPLLGICLGMQLLFARSSEFGTHEGLGLLPGEITDMAPRLPEGLKTPQIGWNALHLARPEHPLLKYTKEGDFVYFVHSYSAVGCGDALLAETEYGIPVTAAAGRANVMGCQFHPEKSGDAGLSILRAFLEL